MADTNEMRYPGFLESEIGSPGPEGALFHVLPAPLEQTVSYGSGTGRGPGAILAASQQLELLDGATVPARAGIHTLAPVDCGGERELVLEELERIAGDIVRRAGIPVVLGGEHTVTVGAVRGVGRALGGDLGVVQIDAHADLRDQYLDDPYSHACVMRRIAEEGMPVFQIGVRSMSEEERDYRESRGIGHLDAEQLKDGKVPPRLLPDDFPQRIYVTIDVDGFDPSIIPATGTPEPGGLGWWQGVELLAVLARERMIVGFDAVELAPVPGLHYAEYAVARLIYRFMREIVARREAKG